MRLPVALAVALLTCFAFGSSVSRAADDEPAPEANSPLEGVWVATELTVDGKNPPQEAIERMRFTFRGNDVLVRGNFRNDREEKNTFTIDETTSPKEFTMTTESDQQVLGIYQLEGDTLTLCLRHASSDKGRPTEFVSEPESRLVLIKFKRQ